MLQTKKKKLTTKRDKWTTKPPPPKKKNPWLPPRPQITIPNDEAPQAFWAVPERWMEGRRSGNIWSFWKSWAALLTSGRELVESTYSFSHSGTTEKTADANILSRDGSFWNFTIPKTRASVFTRALTDKDD